MVKWIVLIGLVVLTVALMFATARPANAKDSALEFEQKLGALVQFTAERGAQQVTRDGLTRHISKKEKLGETVEKRMYLTVWLLVSTDGTRAVPSQVDFIEEIWSLEDGQVVIRQKAGIDGGDFGPMDGILDHIREGKLVKALDHAILDHKIWPMDPAAIAGWQKDFVDEMFTEILGPKPLPKFNL